MPLDPTTAPAGGVPATSEAATSEVRSRPLRIAMVGAGWWATKAHLPALSANPAVELVAVVDPDPTRTESACGTFGVPTSHSDVEALLGATPVDGIVVATPHTTHFPIVAAALRAGVSVLVDKPMATTAADAWQLVELARRSGVHLAVGATYQYSPTADRVREAVQRRIGELVSVNAEFSSSTYPLFATLDRRDAHLDVPGVAHGTTYSDPGLSGGGQGQTQLSHVLGSVIWSAGQQAVEVVAFMDNRGLKVDVVDAVAFRLDGGALCVVSSTGTSVEGIPVRHQIRFHGTHGMVEYDMLAADAWLYRRDGTATHFPNPVDRPSYDFAGPVDGFVDLLLGRRESRAPGDVAAASVAIIDAAYESARAGRPVRVSRGPLESTLQAESPHGQ